MLVRAALFTNYLNPQEGGGSSPTITALLMAISTKEKSMVRLLVEQGANFNLPARGRIRHIPLQRAAKIGDLALVQFLYNIGAGVKPPPARIGDGTALQLAAIGGYTAIAMYLLNQGAEVNAAAALRDGKAVLEGAAPNGRVDTDGSFSRQMQ